MSDDFLGELLGKFVLLTGIAQIVFAGYFAFRRNWPEFKSVMLMGVAWFISTMLVVFWSIGACAAGCPGEPFGTVVNVLVVLPSVGALGWRILRYKANTGKTSGSHR